MLSVSRTFFFFSLCFQKKQNAGRVGKGTATRAVDGEEKATKAAKARKRRLASKMEREEGMYGQKRGVDHGAAGRRRLWSVRNSRNCAHVVSPSLLICTDYDDDGGDFVVPDNEVEFLDDDDGDGGATGSGSDTDGYEGPRFDEETFIQTEQEEAARALEATMPPREAFESVTHRRVWKTRRSALIPFCALR